MNEFEIGQVISMRIRFNNTGVTADKAHPYLIVGMDSKLNVIEIAQLDSLAGKEYRAAKRSNKIIYADEPIETVIDKDSYIQLDNTIRIEYFAELVKFRRQTDKLSQRKLQDVLRAYRKYHEEHEIDENKNVYMDKNEILSLNPDKRR